MKSHTLSTIILFIAISLLSPANAFQDHGKSAEAALNNIDAIQALAIANQWKWSHMGVKSYVTPWDVVFKFANGNIKKVPLPADKMVVAVAPYIKRTHK